MKKDKKAIQNYAKEHPNCEVCGKKAVDVHHIVYRSHMGTENALNLVSLCRHCHQISHGQIKGIKAKNFRELLKRIK